MQELVELKVAFVSSVDNIDLTTAAGEALAGMLCVFAQFERQLIIERWRELWRHCPNGFFEAAAQTDLDSRLRLCPLSSRSPTRRNADSATPRAT
jgi:DNA invertase Pin-like site-specific DNA recombinase